MNTSINISFNKDFSSKKPLLYLKEIKYELLLAFFKKLIGLRLDLIKDLHKAFNRLNRYYYNLIIF